MEQHLFIKPSSSGTQWVSFWEATCSQKRWEKSIGNYQIPEHVRGVLKKAVKFGQSFARGLFIGRKIQLPSHNNGTETFYRKTKG